MSKKGYLRLINIFRSRIYAAIIDNKHEALVEVNEIIFHLCETFEMENDPNFDRTFFMEQINFGVECLLNPD